MPRPRIVIALDPERVSPEAIELGHALALATGAPLTLLAIWRWWEPVELAMLAGQSLRDEADESATGCETAATTSPSAYMRARRSARPSMTPAVARRPA